MKRIAGMRRPEAAVLLVGALLFLPFLGRHDIVASHEARVAQTARQIAAAGWPWQEPSLVVPQVSLTRVDGALRLLPAADGRTIQVNPWLVPVMNEQIRLQKPPLPYWCAAILFKLFGVGEAAARLPSALLGFLSTFLIVDLGRKFLGRAGGAIAGLIWVSTYFIVDEHRKAMADPYLAFATLLCLWAWIRATQARSDRAQCAFVVVVYLSLGVGMLAKGPVVLLHAVLAMGAYTVCCRPRWPRSWRSHLLGMSLFLLITIPWPSYVLSHVPHAIELWRYESIGELTDNVEKGRPAWFYLPAVLELALPWTPLALIGAARALREVRLRGTQQGFFASAAQRRHLFPLAWLAATVFCFSFLNVKKHAYLLPAMPAVVLLASQGVKTTYSWVRRRRRRAMPVTLAHTRRLISIAGGITASAIAIVLSIPVAQGQNARSPRPMCIELARYVAARDSEICIRDLPEEASFYLPLNLSRTPSNRSVVIVNDRYNQFEASTDTLSTRFPGRTIVSVERLTLTSTPPRGRWKVYEVVTTLARRQG